MKEEIETVEAAPEPEADQDSNEDQEDENDDQQDDFLDENLPFEEEVSKITLLNKIFKCSMRILVNFGFEKFT